MRRLQVAGADRYVDKPEKNRYSHVVEAGQYAMIGAGEGYAVVGMDIEDVGWGHDYGRENQDGRNPLSGY